MLLAAPEPKSQAHLPKWHVVQHKTHFWDHHSQTQPLEQSWALPESRTPEAEQPHFIPNPQAPLPKLVVTSGGIGGRGGVSPSAGAKQKLMPYAGLASFLPHTALPQRAGASTQSQTPNLSCSQEGMEEFGETVPWD